MGLPVREKFWSIDPKRTAHLAIDIQNDFLDDDGFYREIGIDITHLKRVIEPIGRLHAACQERGIPTFWTQHGTGSNSEAGLLADLAPGILSNALKVGTWGYEIHSAFTLGEHDVRIPKLRLSAFFQTDLELRLRGLGIDTLIVTGVLTNQCVASSVKDALFRDIKPIVVEEATGTTRPHLQEPVMEMIRVGWGQVNSLEATLRELGVAT